MTIKEMEQLTGMARANIRFYEQEGLILPRRQENGYRVYTREDGETLLRIKLLRSMEIPLEEIKGLQAGSQALSSALQELLDGMQEKQLHLERTRMLAESLLAVGAEYGALDARRYLRVLDGTEECLRRDVVPRLNLPWRRFWARALDWLLYSTAVGLLLRNFLLRDVLTPLLTLTAMLLVEPLLLQLFGTTAGKVIFGIWVTDVEDGPLAYARGLERTWMVLFEGMALNIPMLSQYFMFRSYQTLESGGAPNWEQDSELIIQDDKMYRYVLFAGAYILILAANWILWMGG